MASEDSENGKSASNTEEQMREERQRLATRELEINQEQKAAKTKESRVFTEQREKLEEVLHAVIEQKLALHKELSKLESLRDSFLALSNPNPVQRHSLEASQKRLASMK
ncbi:unnamed protein product [Calypogeia fissa]